MLCATCCEPAGWKRWSSPARSRVEKAEAARSRADSENRVPPVTGKLPACISLLHKDSGKAKDRGRAKVKVKDSGKDKVRLKGRDRVKDRVKGRGRGRNAAASPTRCRPPSDLPEWARASPAVRLAWRAEFPALKITRVAGTRYRTPINRIGKQNAGKQHVFRHFSCAANAAGTHDSRSSCWRLLIWGYARQSQSQRPSPCRTGFSRYARDGKILVPRRRIDLPYASSAPLMSSSLVNPVLNGYSQRSLIRQLLHFGLRAVQV